jgi:transposase
LIESREDTISNIAFYHLVKADKLRRHYKKKSSNYSSWEQRGHAEDYLIYPENIDEYLSIDEVSLSKGELYTFVTNKLNNGRKGSLVACIKGTKSQDIVKVLQKIPLEKREKVKEVSLDMASNMSLSVEQSFGKSSQVTDRFHVVKLVYEALQHLRIKLRWEAIDAENAAIKEAKIKGEKFIAKLFINGDSLKQLLARSRYVIAKKSNEWTGNQKQRAELLFSTYPTLEKAYHLTMEFRNIYEEKIKDKAAQKLKLWIERAEKFENNVFKTAVHSIENHKETILNFFDNRTTNANAESFNARIKLFRSNQRGVVDTSFFLFRLEKLFA